MTTFLNDNIKISIPPIYYYSSPTLQTSYKCLSSRSEHKLIYFTPFCPIEHNSEFNNINNQIYKIEGIHKKNFSNSKTSIIKSCYKLENQTKPKKVVSFLITKKESKLNKEKSKTPSVEQNNIEPISTDILNKNYDELIEKLKKSPPSNRITADDKIKILKQSKKFKSKSKSDNDFNIPIIKNDINKKIKEIKIEDNNTLTNLCKSKSIDLRGKTVPIVKLLSNAEEKVKNFTNTETISDFYEYTEKCMSMILDLDISKQKKIEEKVNCNFPIEEKKKKNRII